MSPGVFRDNCILSRSSYRFSSSIKAGVARESLILLKRHYPSLIMNALVRKKANCLNIYGHLITVIYIKK